MYIKSSLIKVFPSAYRSGTDNETTATVFDPESKLTVEDNMAGFYRHSLSKDSFVVSLDSAGGSGLYVQSLSFVIYGYYFSVSDISSIVSSLNPTNGSSVYAHIYVRNGNGNTDYTFESLTNDAGAVGALDATSSTDASPLPATYSFQGIVFDQSSTPTVTRSGCTAHTLKLFSVSVNTVGGCWLSGSSYYQAVLYEGAVYELDAVRVYDGSASVHTALANQASSLSAEAERAKTAEKTNADNLNRHVADTTDNPHKVTKAQVGLGNCDNTSDADKPISGKQAAVNKTLSDDISTDKGIMDSHIADTSNPHSVTKEQVGLGNCDNTSDLGKPISTLTQAALDKKQATLSVSNGTTVRLTLSNNVLSGSYALPTADTSNLGGVRICDTLTTTGADADKAVYSKTVSKGLAIMSATYTAAISKEDTAIRALFGDQVTYTYSAGTLYITAK